VVLGQMISPTIRPTPDTGLPDENRQVVAKRCVARGECWFAFSVGGLTFRGECFGDVCFDPGSGVFHRDSRVCVSNTLRCRRTQQRSEARQQAREAPFGLLALPLFVAAEARFQDLGAPRQSFALAELRFGLFQERGQAAATSRLAGSVCSLAISSPNRWATSS
jgi:hypothetical protein